MNETHAILSAAIFAIAALFTPGPHAEPLAVPPSYALEAYHAAAEYDDVSPAEVVGLLVMEHRGKPPYRHDSVGRSGELGLMQISPFWARRYRAHAGDVDLLDPHVNIRAGAWVVHQMKASHAKRCRGDGHTWLAHYRCGSGARDGCPVADRARMIARLTSAIELAE